VVNEVPCPDKDTLKLFFERQGHDVPLDRFLNMWWRWEAHDPELAPIEMLSPEDTEPELLVNIVESYADLH
jgi:hypothetical protein